MTEPQLCRLCRTPVLDAAVCYLCVEGDAEGLNTHHKPSLAANLGDVASVTQSLLVTYTRQTRTGDRAGSRSAETALPYDKRASEAADTLRNTLTTWVRVIEVEQDDLASGPMATLAAWLLCRTERIRHHESASECVTDIARAMDQARKVIDLPAELIYAGPCQSIAEDDRNGDHPCPEHLYASPGSTSVECRACGTEFDVKERREWMLAAANDILYHASMIARALTALDRPVTADRIYKWAERGRIVPHGTDKEGRPLYRVGDIVDALVTDTDAQAKKASKLAQRHAQPPPARQSA